MNVKLDDEGTMASSFSPSKRRRYSEVDIEGRISALFALNLELNPAKLRGSSFEALSLRKTIAFIKLIW